MDTYVDRELVDLATEALLSFGGQLTRIEAEQLLPLCRYWADLTVRDRVAVLAQFDSPAPPTRHLRLVPALRE